MEKQQVIEALSKARESSKKRNFKQSVDLIINLKNFDVKKAEHQIDASVNIPHERGRKVKVCALVGRELEENAKNSCDKVIISDEFKKFKKKDSKKLASEFEYFVAQANLMPQVATAFGPVFGPRGRMPNPKVGCIVPPNANLAPLYAKLQKTLRLSNKKSPLLQCSAGVEDLGDDKLIENIISLYNSAVALLPNDKNSVKNVQLKLTMGKPVVIEAKKKK